MRRTGKDLDSPATGIEACAGAGMTKEVAFMRGLGGCGRKSADSFTRLRGSGLGSLVASRAAAGGRTTRSGRRGGADRDATSDPSPDQRNRVKLSADFRPQ